MSGDQLAHGKDIKPGFFNGIGEAIANAGLMLAQEAQELHKEQQKNSATQDKAPSKDERPFFERADSSDDFLLSREELKSGLKSGSQKDPEIRNYTNIYENFDKIAGDDNLLSLMEIVLFEAERTMPKDR